MSVAIFYIDFPSGGRRKTLLPTHISARILLASLSSSESRRLRHESSTAVVKEAAKRHSARSALRKTELSLTCPFQLRTHRCKNNREKIRRRLERTRLTLFPPPDELLPVLFELCPPLLPPDDDVCDLKRCAHIDSRQGRIAFQQPRTAESDFSNTPLRLYAD